MEQKSDNQIQIDNQPKSNSLLRVLILGIIVLGLAALYKFTVVGDWLQPERLEKLVREAGIWGVFIFFGIFLLGTLMNLPGAIFLIFSVIIYGYWMGTILSYFTALLAAWLNFEFARAIGGKALSDLKNKRLRKILAQVDSKPIRTIIILRLILLLSPLINYALALTSIRRSKFIIGNAVGMLIPFAIILLGTVLVRSSI
ncbi:MAG: VTT domain-containing protein [Saprospiraceae bacterium]|nr:VTT domain-containing protein [Saprospiraceae bacterium]